MAATTVTHPLLPISSRRRKLCFSSSINADFSTTNVISLRRCRPTTGFLRLEKGRNLTIGARAWGGNPRSGMVMGDYGDDIDEDDDDEEDDDEEEDSSLDLLIRFVENVFRKVSKKARKAVKSVLPVPISSKLFVIYDGNHKMLVGFAVNGTIILTFLWVLKAFLEVICTLGSVVFASILLIRGVWAGISYFQDNRIYRADDDDPKSWSRTQPAI